MKLTRQERTRILDGSYGPLYRKEKPDLDPGTQIVVSWTRPRGWVDEDEQAGTWHAFKPEAERSMWIVVTDVVRRTKGGWSVYFRVVDHRQPVWYLGATGYTRSRAQARDELEVPLDTKTQARVTAEAKQAHYDQRQKDEEARLRETRRQERAVRDRLRETMQGLPPPAQVQLLAAVQRLIAEAEDQEKAA